MYLKHRGELMHGYPFPDKIAQIGSDDSGTRSGTGKPENLSILWRDRQIHHPDRPVGNMPERPGTRNIW